MTEMTYKPGNISCSEARELLSDLIDARRGEIPHPDGTRLSEPGLRAAVELHVAACQECREELESLEEVGAVFAGFDVGELPVQAFSDYGQLARERMAREKTASPGRMDYFWRQTSFWLTLGASGMVAASFFMMIQPSLSGKSNREILALNGGPHRVAIARQTKRVAPEPIRYKVPMPNGAQIVPVNDPSDCNELQRLRQYEARALYLEFPAPLLGASLQTTRDTDRVAGEDPIGLRVSEVLPGSPAQAMGLMKDDYIVQWNNVSVTNGGAEETVKFLMGINKLGAGTPVSLHVIRPEGSQFVYRKPMTGVLGEYDAAQ